MGLKIDGDLESKATTAGTPAIDLEPTKENEDKKWWSELPKTLWNHFKENFPKYFYTGLAGIAGYLWRASL